MTKLTPEEAKERLDQIVREAKLSPPLRRVEKPDPKPAADAPLEEIIAWHMRNAEVPEETLEEKAERAYRLAKHYLGCTP